MSEYCLGGLDELSIAKRHLGALLSNIESLETIRFPYEDAKNQLKTFEALIRERQKKLELINAKTDSDVVIAECRVAIDLSYRLPPMLGFILRSTNTRNAFEIRAGLLEITRQCLGGHDYGLIISSEWNFSPGILIGMSNPIMIGMPAIESSNAFLASLAGHEIGHAIWKKQKFSKKYEDDIQKEVVDITTQGGARAYFEELGSIDAPNLFEALQINRPIKWALEQVEEVFCDFVGLWLFGEAYLWAFCFYLSLRQYDAQKSRVPEYPTVKTRAELLLAAYDVLYENTEQIVRDTLYQLFCSAGEDSENGLQRLADTAAVNVCKRTLLECVTETLDKTNVQRPNLEHIQNCEENFKEMVPTGTPASMADILIAGWKVLLDKQALEGLGDRKENVLNDLVLKSFELLEFASAIN
jgi:hypothetical protein